MSTYNSDVSETNATIKEEIIDLMEKVKLERRKYNEYQIIKQVAFECTKEGSGLSSELQTKVYNILMISDLQEDINLPKGTLLDLDLNINTYDLTSQEKEELKEAVQHGLMEKRRSITKELCELGISIEEDLLAQCHPGLSITTQEKVLFDLKNQLLLKQELYVKLLEELIAVFEQFINLKNKSLPVAAQEKMEACEVQSQLTRLKGEVINVKLRINVFTETTKSLGAYKEMLKDILQQQTEYKTDIEQLQVLKEKYKQVSCKEYDEILKSYLQYKSNIEKKKQLHVRLQRQ